MQHLGLLSRPEHLDLVLPLDLRREVMKLAFCAFITFAAMPLKSTARPWTSIAAVVAAVMAIDTKMDVTVGNQIVPMDARFKAAIHFVACVDLLKVSMKSMKVVWSIPRMIQLVWGSPIVIQGWLQLAFGFALVKSLEEDWVCILLTARFRFRSCQMSTRKDEAQYLRDELCAGVSRFRETSRLLTSYPNPMERPKSPTSIRRPLSLRSVGVCNQYETLWRILSHSTTSNFPDTARSTPQSWHNLPRKPPWTVHGAQGLIPACGYADRLGGIGYIANPSVKRTDAKAMMCLLPC
ncbi:hypothetical protein KCU65_g360, partial [Aureobasidium melanogenum]